MNSPEIIDAVGKLITFDWVKEKAGSYFDNAEHLNEEDYLTIRAKFTSDVMRNKFKPKMESLDSNCAIFLKKICGRLIEEKIAGHMREQENHQLAK
ncbi:MAG: hypothetical protein P8P30_00740 [Rickettsiales bacterium]|nr:hypothetical protein [Rickettsiales bacterium]